MKWLWSFGTAQTPLVPTVKVGIAHQYQRGVPVPETGEGYSTMNDYGLLTSLPLDEGNFRLPQPTFTGELPDALRNGAFVPVTVTVPLYKGTAGTACEGDPRAAADPRHHPKLGVVP